MKAVLCKTFGSPESLVLEEVTAPVPDRDEVLINIHSSALNFPDVLMIAGKYQSQPSFPFSPGGEISGIVAAIGAEVSRFQVGDSVFASVGYGGFAEQIVVKEQALRAKPVHMSFEQAAGISTTYGTSYYALKQRAALQPGENLLVLGAGGGVGITAVEIGKTMGARVIAAASTTDKLDAARTAGADLLIDYSDGELKEKVKDLTGGKGADVIYDPVGGALFDQCMRCINWYGRLLVIGFAAGDIPKLPINLVLLKSCQVVGVFYGAWSARYVSEANVNFQEILELIEQGKINPLVGNVYPLEQYADALRCLSERKAIGKVVINIQ